jgi:hypothetical protein
VVRAAPHASRHAAAARVVGDRGRLLPDRRVVGQRLEPGDRRGRIVDQRAARLQQHERAVLGLDGGALPLGGPALLLGHAPRGDDARHRDPAEDREQRGRARDHGHHGASPRVPAGQAIPARVAARAHHLPGGEALQVDRQLRGRRVALGGVGGHGLAHDLEQVRRHVGRALLQRDRLPQLHRAQERGHAPVEIAVRRLPGEDLVEHDAEREDVGALVDALTGRLLGRHVRRRPHDVAETRRVVAQAAAGAGRDQLGTVVVERLGQPPVDHDGLAERADDHVGRLEVAVDHAARVRVADRLAHRLHLGDQREPLGERLRGAQDLEERAPLDQLHGVERLARGPAAGLVDRDDPRVLQARGDQRLAHEARLLAGAEELLDRHLAPEARVLGAHDLPDAAATDLAGALVDRRVDDGERGDDGLHRGELEIRLGGGGHRRAVVTRHRASFYHAAK